MHDEKATAHYEYSHNELGSQHEYLLPAVEDCLKRFKPDRVFELGCGNGSVSAWMARLGMEVCAIDASHSGIEQARSHFPGIRFEVRSAYDNLSEEFGRFPMVLSLEVIEHLYSPRLFTSTVFNLLEPGGHAVISTPYHGYWKNLAIAASGKFDHHFSALWDGGHIKFWSRDTLAKLLAEAGFSQVHFRRVGRIPALAKSMVAIAKKPE